MRSSASLLLLLAGCGGSVPATGRPQIADAPAPAAPMPRPAPRAASQPLPDAAPPELAAADGPSATTGVGLDRYDHVGMASWYGDAETGDTTASGAAFDPDAIAAAHRTLPIGSIAEVTSLDTGRIILVRIADRGPSDHRYEIDLTRGAAGLLGANGGATPVRVRAVTASAADAGALARGEPASPRMDAPPALLAALRRQLPTGVAIRTPPPRSKAPTLPANPRVESAPPRSPARAAPAPVTVGARYVVQVAAFSTEARATDLARDLGGSVLPGGALWRVRLGPYRDLAAAQRARDAAARRGYGDAQVLPSS